jgi:hypothetical protein
VASGKKLKASSSELPAMSSVFDLFSAHWPPVTNPYSLAVNRWPLATALCLLACSGCAKQKTTEELMADLKAGNDRDRIIAVRTLPLREG